MGQVVQDTRILIELYLGYKKLTEDNNLNFQSLDYFEKAKELCELLYFSATGKIIDDIEELTSELHGMLTSSVRLAEYLNVYLDMLKTSYKILDVYKFSEIMYYTRKGISFL